MDYNVKTVLMGIQFIMAVAAIKRLSPQNALKFSHKHKVSSI